MKRKILSKGVLGLCFAAAALVMPQDSGAISPPLSGALLSPPVLQSAGESPRPEIPDGVIRIGPKGEIWVGEGILSFSLLFTSSGQLQLSLPNTEGEPFKFSCEDLGEVMQEFSGEKGEEFAEALTQNVAEKNPSFSERLERHVIRNPSAPWVLGGQILRGVIQNMLGQLERDLWIAKIACMRPPSREP